MLVATYIKDNLGNVTGLKYPNGEVFDGELDSKNDPDGFGILKDAEGNIICEGYFYNDVYDYIKQYNKDRKRIIQPIK